MLVTNFRVLLAAVALGAGLAHAADADFGAAAAMGSRISVATMQLASRHSPNPNLDGECVASINTARLAPEHEAMLRRLFSPADLEQLNAFATTTAAAKYVDEALKLVGQRAFGIESSPDEYTPEEEAQLRDLTASEVGTKFFEVLNTSNPEWKASVGPGLMRMLAACKKE